MYHYQNAHQLVQPVIYILFLRIKLEIKKRLTLNTDAFDFNPSNQKYQAQKIAEPMRGVINLDITLNKQGWKMKSYSAWTSYIPVIHSSIQQYFHEYLLLLTLSGLQVFDIAA